MSVWKRAQHWLCALTAAAFSLVPPALSQNAAEAEKNEQNGYFKTNQEYCKKTLSKIDELVKKHFYDPKIATGQWQQIHDKYSEQITSSQDCLELGQSINQALAELHSSHTQFVTTNDETFYFLRSLFTAISSGQAKQAPTACFTGLGIGGVGCAKNVVRYVLDGSPAAKAGFKRGDMIDQINGLPYRGQSTLNDGSEKELAVQIRRQGNPLELKLHPVKRDYYSAYAEAISKSVKKYKNKTGVIGYVHLWCGGQKAHEALEELLEGELHETSGLILDLRDGYGGNSLEDLDYFYRWTVAYPVFRTVDRNGKADNAYHTYNKPLVALINGGSRSGKELLAYSLKKTGRAKLIGETTAGYVLAGRFFELDERSALYLAVLDGTVDGKRLEGIGVKPDITVNQPCLDSCDRQFAVALKYILQETSRAKQRHTKGRLTLPKKAS